MKQLNTNDLSAEVQGISAALYVLSGMFLEDEVHNSREVIGSELHALARLGDRIGEDLADM